MWHPARETRSVMAFLLAAAVAFFGCAVLLKAGRAFPALAGGAPGDGHPGFLLLAVVILLAAAGALLLAMAGKELVDLLRQPRVR
jgi:hypothetical protein